MAATYRLRWEGASRPTQRGLPGYRGESHPSVSSLDTIWPLVRLHMANESTNGEVFIQPLSTIRHVLESAVMNKRTGEQRGGVAGGRGSQMALYSLAIEYIPRLLAYMPRIRTNKPEMGVILLDCLCYLLATEQESLYSFLVTFSSSLLHLPCEEWPQACHEIISRLCHFVLPTLLRTRTTHPNTQHVFLPPLSMSSTLMIVMETCSVRLQLLTTDTLMFLKRNVCTDILSLVSHGTLTVCQNALKLLLHYWPISTDLSRTVSLYGEWLTPECENSACRHDNIQASMLCLDSSCVSHHKSRTVAGDQAKLYMLLCHECHSVIHRTVADSDVTHPTIQIPQPLRDVKPNCEFQKMCSGKERQVNKADVTCYDNRCTAIQGGQPIRMCQACHSKQHTDSGDLQHIYQVGPPNPWTSSDSESSSAMLEAVSKLLQSPPVLHKVSTAPPTVGRSASHTLLDGLQKIHALPYQLMVEGSREGIWLLSQYCTPTGSVSDEHIDWLVHLSALALEWLRVYHDILKQVEDEIPSSPSNEDSDNLSPDVTEYLQYFSNYNDISRLVDPLLITWLCEVAKTNSHCLVEALKPNLQPCAQVGKLWDKECDSILRYQSSLRSLHQLYVFYKSSHIPREAFKRIYDSVMPEWLDLLVQLRMETGKMVTLHTHYHRLITQPHPEGMEMIGFIWDKFTSTKTASGVEIQRGLLWLQDLTRLKIALPYIHHMFESAMEQKIRRSSDNLQAKVSVASSFDEEVEERRVSMERERKGSTGSNVSDSESAILSESHLDELDTQAITSLNSSLTRSILMLDIWLSQMKLGQHMLNYTMLQRLLVKMLQMSWGSKHSYNDHHDTTNTCLLCKATALWFSLVTQLLKECEQQLEEAEEEHDGVVGSGFASRGDNGRPSRLQQQRISMKLVLKKKLRKLTHGETNASDDFKPHILSPGGNFSTFPRKKADENRRGASPGVISGKGKSPQRGEDSTDFDREFPPAEVRSKPRKVPLRKMATVQSEGVQQSLPAVLEREELTEGEESSAMEEDNEDIHTVFKLCRDHLKPKLHPEAIHKVVECLVVLVRKCRVLHEMEETKAMEEARALFKDAWKCLGGQSSNGDRSCVGLLIDSLKFLNDHEMSNGLNNSTGWVTFYHGLKNDKFKTIEKFCIFMEFMLSPETELDWNEDSSTVIAIQVTVAHSFCVAVQLLQDKTSSVASRAHYFLSNLSVTTLKALRKFIMRLFLDHPSHRTLTLHSLSLLNTALPKLGLLTLDLLEHIMLSVTPAASSSLTNSTNRLSGGDHTSKKESVASLSEVSVPTPKTSISSGLPSSPMAPATNAVEESELLQLSLALLLKYLANPASDAEESLKKTRLDRSNRESLVEPDMKPVILFRFSGLHNDPPSLRANPVFHVFLNHIYPVLDNSPEFSSLNALNFILNRLITSTAPTGEESFLQYLDHSGGREGKRCEFSLGVLPPPLRVPWLRVFYIILYKYIHSYQSTVIDGHLDLIFLVRCCMEIVLNTMEAIPHTCPLLPTTSTIQSTSLQRRPRPADSINPGGSASQPTTSVFQDDSLHYTSQRKKERSSLSPLRESSPSSPIQSIPISATHKLVRATPSSDSTGSVGSVSSVFFHSGSSIPKLHSGLCSVCGHITNEFAEDEITHCAIVLAACCHRLPTRVSGYLVSHVIPALAKVINTEQPSYTWQSSSEEQPPGSAVAVARNLLKSVATQFADRRLFIFLFNHQYLSERVVEQVFTALGGSLPPPSISGEGDVDVNEGDSEEMTVVSPLTYFLQDAVKSHNFAQDVRTVSLVHLALYVEKTPLSVTSMFWNINLLDSFCKKLRMTALFRDTKAVHAFMRFIIQVLISAPDNMPHSILRSPPVHSFSQSLTTCMEVIFSSVSCPVGGLFQLAGHWYKTFLASPRDANRLVNLYISELRKALKANQTTEIGTFVSLVQVLLLEESGHLSYVDGLTNERVYAPKLREQFEYGDIFLNAIQETQWDFVDAMLFLDTSPNRLPVQYVQELPRLKLLIGQLVALRVQHSRSPVDHLRRVINRDLRPISLPIKGVHQRFRWYEQLSALHILAWLLLGAMCHNAVHQVTGALGGGRCQLLGSLDANLEMITSNVIWLTRGAMQGIRKTSDNSGSHCQYLLFTFTAIWTYYMETWEPNSTPDIIQFWENFVSNMVDMLGDYNITDEKHRMNVLNNVNDMIIIPLKKCGLSCFTMLTPIWRKLSNQLTAGHFQVFPNIPENITTVTMDTWFKDMVSELVTVERESSPHIATTAL